MADIKYDQDMSQQAHNIWSMLDDMANSDPQAYKKFIDKQMKDGKEFMSPPTPHMCVKTTMLSPKKTLFFINFCSWPRVPEPKSPDDPVSVTGTDIIEGRDDHGLYSMTSCAFNPKVTEEYGHDTKSTLDRDTLVNLAIDFIQNHHKVDLSRNYTLLPREITHKGDITLLNSSFSKNEKKGEKQFEDQLSELEETFGPLAAGANNSLLNKLVNLSTEDRGNSQNLNGHNNKPTYDTPGINMPNSTKVNKTGLIEEISSSKNSKLSCPVYKMDTTCNSRGEIETVVMKVDLPGVRSVADCELDISEDDLKLTVEGCYDLHVTFPCRIIDDEAAAKFSKKSSVLTVTVPAVGKS